MSNAIPKYLALNSFIQEKCLAIEDNSRASSKFFVSGGLSCKDNIIAEMKSIKRNADKIIKAIKIIEEAK